MIALIINLVLAAWLLISASVLLHSPLTAWSAMIVAVISVAASFMAFSAPGRPGFRHVNSLLAIYLVGAAIVLPHLSMITVFNEVAVGMGLALVALFTPVRSEHDKEVRAHAHG
jgi:hypothetical protein